MGSVDSDSYKCRHGLFGLLGKCLLIGSLAWPHANLASILQGGDRMNITVSDAEFSEKKCELHPDVFPSGFALFNNNKN